MLAGCYSSTLLSPRHRGVKSEVPSPSQFQAFHFQLSSMSIQRLDLSCSASQKFGTSRSLVIRPVGISIEKSSIESKTSTCSLKQNIQLPPLAISRPITNEGHGEVEDIDRVWEKGKCLKRFADQGREDDESCKNRAKRKQGSRDDEKGYNTIVEMEGGSLSIGRLSGGNFWFRSGGFDVPSSQILLCFTCSADQGVSFMSSEVISSAFPLLNNPWVEANVVEITEFVEKDGETSHGPVKDVSGSISLALRLNENHGEKKLVTGQGLCI